MPSAFHAVAPSHTDRSVARPTPTLARLGILAFGVAAYLIGAAALVVLILATLGVSPLPGGLVRIANPIAAALFNLGLIAMFGIQHSVMARAGFKQRWTRVIHPAMERSMFLLATAAVLLPVVLLWQPLPAVLWSWSAPVVRTTLTALALLGWAYLLVATFAIDHWELFGLRQSWDGFRARPPRPVRFRERLMYRFDRHPIMTGVLVGLWAAPDMTVGRFLLAAGFSAYVIVGVSFEERALGQELGEAYVSYRRRVPSLVPTMRPGRNEPFAVTRRITASPEQVWRHLADVAGWPDWLPTMRSVQPLGPRELALGARYRVSQPWLPPAIWTVVGLEPCRSFAWESRSPGVRVLAEHMLDPLPDGSTRVTLRVGFSGPLAGFARLVGGALTRAYIAREAALLKQRAETLG